MLTALLFLIVACGSAETTPATTSNATSIATATPSTATSGNGPRTIQNLIPGEVYVWRVAPEQTQVSYSVNETLFGNPHTTVGTTSTVEGEFGLVGRDGKPAFQNAKLRVDLRTLTSDNRLRDETLRRTWLESNKYPYAEFVPKEIADYPSNPSEGQEVHFKVTGDMTIRNITHPVTFDVTAKAEGDTLSGTGTTFLLMRDYGIDPPEMLGRFKVEDGVTLTIKGVAKLIEGSFQ
jgi:polyisoprenoid-binding protein YceI